MQEKRNQLTIPLLLQKKGIDSQITMTKKELIPKGIDSFYNFNFHPVELILLKNSFFQFLFLFTYGKCEKELKNESIYLLESIHDSSLSGQNGIDSRFLIFHRKSKKESIHEGSQPNQLIRVPVSSGSRLFGHSIRFSVPG